MPQNNELERTISRPSLPDRRSIQCSTGAPRREIMALLLAAVASSAFGGQPTAPALRVLAAGGVGGRNWYAEMASDGSIGLEYSDLYHHDNDFKRTLEASDRRLSTVRIAVANAEFLQLPANITRKMVTIDASALRLTVTLGNKSHSVFLYEPEELARDKRAKRFLAVWNALFEGVPDRPPW